MGGVCRRKGGRIRFCGVGGGGRGGGNGGGGVWGGKYLLGAKYLGEIVGFNSFYVIVVVPEMDNCRLVPWACCIGFDDISRVD